MTYQDYINCSREALLEKMAELLPEKRLTHCLGVERAAIELAQRFGVDTEKAGLAGLLHDYAKKLSDQEFLNLIDRYQLDPDLKNWGNNVWHGMVGIYKIQEDLDLHDPEILRAIEIHTVGAGQMKLLPEKRLTHCLGVERAAIELAQRFGVDTEKAGLAGLLHDYAKKLSDQEFLNLIDRYQLDPDLKNWGNNVWHGMVGIYKIQEDLDLHDPEILRAIEIHTVGAGQMTDLDKVIYVADYIEHNRAFPGVDVAREIASLSLNKAVAYETARTVEHLAHQGFPIYPQTLETYNAFVHYLKED